MVSVHGHSRREVVSDTPDFTLMPKYSEADFSQSQVCDSSYVAYSCSWHEVGHAGHQLVLARRRKPQRLRPALARPSCQLFGGTVRCRSTAGLLHGSSSNARARGFRRGRPGQGLDRAAALLRSLGRDTSSYGLRD